MARLPRGTVTFLFSDIEGSTRLLARLRAGYAGVLAEHRRLLRGAFREHDGREVHTEGDAFFVVFVRASDAVAAAVGGQRALAAHRWGDGVELRVRMGLHTGEGEVAAGDYVGLDVHRAARICAAGHGGQVLLSASTRALTAGELPSDVAVCDLGDHRLKDLDRPERLFQLVVADLPSRFPVLASLSDAPVGPGALPLLPNRTIGREDEVRAVCARLGAGARLLTLTGPGGVGKTRLAIETAHAARSRFADGARLVALDATRRAEDVPAAVLRALAIVGLAGETPEQALMRFLGAKRVLLVLDNFEHVLEAAGLVAELLASCPGVAVLATSREPLALAGEQRFGVGPLRAPSAGGDAPAEGLGRAPSVELFCDRALGRVPDLVLDEGDATAVAQICRRLDGLPLAIELAAARSTLLSVGEIAERLDAAFGMLGSGPRDAPARHHTLRATVDWSYDLLDDVERRCFARLAVFAGGATVQAAEAIADADLETLDRLVAKSLLVRRGGRGDAPSRLAMLETIRAYATERLVESGEADAVRGRHYAFHLELARRHASEQALFGAGRAEHLTRLDEELDNLHEALRWASTRADAEQALALSVALAWYWLIRHRYEDAVAWIDRALSLSGTECHRALRVRAMCAKVPCLYPLGRADEQGAIMADAEKAARALGDAALLSRVLQVRSQREVHAAEPGAADALADEAVHWAGVAGDEWEIAQAACRKAMAAPTITDLRGRVDHAAAMLDDVGDIFQLSALLMTAAYNAICWNHEADAKAFLDRATPLVRALDDPYLWMLLQGNAGLVALLTENPSAAEQAFSEELSLCRELVVRPTAAEGLLGLAAIAARQGADHRAARLAGAAAAHRYGAQQDLVETRLERIYFEPSRRRYGTRAWDIAAHEGATLSFEDAIAAALEEPRA
jgi:predicted ATPase/class 3 adenylate cyclase